MFLDAANYDPPKIICDPQFWWSLKAHKVRVGHLAALNCAWFCWWTLLIVRQLSIIIKCNHWSNLMSDHWFTLAIAICSRFSAVWPFDSYFRGCPKSHCNLRPCHGMNLRHRVLGHPSSSDSIQNTYHYYMIIGQDRRKVGIKLQWKQKEDSFHFSSKMNILLTCGLPLFWMPQIWLP